MTPNIKASVKRPSDDETCKGSGDSVQRLVRRLMPVRTKRCGYCGHRKSEHSKEALCGDFFWDVQMLPVCIECGKRVCEDEEDELCQVCFKKGLSRDI